MSGGAGRRCKNRRGRKSSIHEAEEVVVTVVAILKVHPPRFPVLPVPFGTEVVLGQVIPLQPFPYTCPAGPFRGFQGRPPERFLPVIDDDSADILHDRASLSRGLRKQAQ